MLFHNKCLRFLLTLSALFCLVNLRDVNLWAADDYERPPINYREGKADNNITRLQQLIDEKKLSLKFSEQGGYLPALLDALEVPVESQTLVFSKTSLQAHRITPRTPRALYFNDDLYLGYVHAGDVLEISVADPGLGTVFYSLEQEENEHPKFIRQTDTCLICHSSSRTENIPGHLVRSMLVERSGQPLFSAGSFSVTHETPFENRWGGWYVTGTHGDQKHMGNLVMSTKIPPAEINNESGHNQTDVSSRFRSERYLTTHSDIIALMVLEHQTLVHNRLVKASFDTRQALHYQKSINETLEQEDDTRYESTTRRIQNAGNSLLEAMLFANEAPLTAPVKGTSGYTEWFEKQGPKDKQGRSLRDFDMTTRMFKYPCSYLIYSSAFTTLPEEVKAHIWLVLWEILNGKNDSEKFSHLTSEDRLAILEILQQTHTELPDYWKAPAQNSNSVAP